MAQRFLCRVCKEDLTERVENTSIVRTTGIRLMTPLDKKEMPLLKAVNPSTKKEQHEILVKCSQGHSNIFRVSE